MTANGWFQIGFSSGDLLTDQPVGIFMTRVFNGEKDISSIPFCDPSKGCIPG